MTSIAQAYVEILPSASGMGGALRGELRGVESTISESTRSGFLGGFARVGGALVGTIGALGIGAAVGSTISRGLDRALNLQDARAQLAGLGHDAQSVETVMTSALDSVRGTAFGLDAAATTAAGAVAAGVRPGADLTRSLSLVADAATIAGTDMGSMGAIFNKVAASDMIQGDVLAQLGDQGIPILQFLADELGVTTAAVRDMASRGEIDFATFQSAMESGLGGSALASGDTARGALANIGAAVGRLGAMFTGGAVASAPVLFQSISGAVDRLAVALAPVAERLDGWIEPAMIRLAGWIDQIDFSSLFGGVDFSSAGAAVASFGSAFSQVSPFLTQVWGGLQSIGGALGGVLAAGLRAAEPLLNVFASALNWVADNGDLLPGIILAIVGALVVYQASQVAANIASLASIPAQLGRTASLFALSAALRAQSAAQVGATASTVAGTIATETNIMANNVSALSMMRAQAATIGARIAMLASAAATGVATAAQWALNAAMSANPIALVVIAIAALVAGLIWFFTQTQLGQEIWANFTQFLGEAWANVSAWFMAVGNGIAVWWNGLWAGISDWFTTVWAGLSTFFTVMWTLITSAFQNGVQGAVDFVVGMVDSILSTILGVGDAIYNAGRSIIQGFIDGIASMIGAVGDAIGGVMDFVAGFFPNSPAKHGPLSGSGWRALGKSGGAIEDAFASGFTGRIDDVLTSGVQVPRVPVSAEVAQYAAGVGGSGATVNVYPSQAMDEYLVGDVVGNTLARVLR